MKKIKFNDFPAEVKVHGKMYKKAFFQVLSSGNFILGNAVKQFEKEFADYLGVTYCIGVANGLEAIQIALLALGISKGDEVITTPISAVATTLAIMAIGAKPIFADTTKDGLINPKLIPQLITKKTKAILPVHLYGHNAYIHHLKSICKKYNLFLVEDACQAHGSVYNQQKLGTFGDVGCFSFYPTKNLGAFGDGGALVTNNPELAKIAYQLRDYGQESKYVHTRVGLNSRLDEVQAAILSTKLRELDKNNAKRLALAKRYIENLSDTEISIVNSQNFSGSNFHLFVIRTEKRDQLKEYLAKFHIPTAIHYPLTIPDQPFFIQKIYSLPISKAFVSEILSLPCHPFMDLKQVDFISGKIIEFFQKERLNAPISLEVFDKIPSHLEKVVKQLKKETYQAIQISYNPEAKAQHEERYCSEKDRFAYIVAFQNKEVIGGLTLLKREISFQDKKVTLGGIAGVWIKTDRQRMGIGTLLLKKAKHILKQNRCQLIYIQIEKKTLSNFYKKFGFLLLKRTHIYFGKSGKRYYERNGMIAPLSSPTLFKIILHDKKPFYIGKGNW